MKRRTFEIELMNLLNQHSIDTDCGVPDFILAEYICSHIETITHLVEKRERWFGRGTEERKETADHE